MTTSAAERHAMRRALELAASDGVPLGPNPRVGCVLLDDDGRTVAEGFHRGAGSPHAEADAHAGEGGPGRPVPDARAAHPTPVRPGARTGHEGWE